MYLMLKVSQLPDFDSRTRTYSFPTVPIIRTKTNLIKPRALFPSKKSQK